jgi:quercetin dioxygenase-like cupin family protein
MSTVKRRMLHLLGCAAIFAAASGLLQSQRLDAQDREPAGFAGNKVTPLIRMDLSGVPNRQVIANLYEVPAGAMVPRHFHHGDELHVLLDGEWAAEVEGQPVHVMKPGDAQYVTQERWHGGRVVGPGPMRLLGVMIVEKDKPVIEMKR